MNVFKQEFHMKIKSIIIWSISLAALMIFYMSFFPYMEQDSETLDSIMNSFPKEMMQALGVRAGLSLGSLMGFFTLTFTIMQIAIAIQSANYGFSILSEEERELTADFLMTKPVSRKKIYLSKFFAALLGLLITFLAVGIGSLIALKLFNGGSNYEVSHVFKLLISVPLFQLTFLSIGMFISLLFKKIRSVLSLSMSLAIGLYVISSVGEIIDSDILRYMTPFHYFEAGVILKTGEYDIQLFLIAVSVIIVSLVSSYLLYNRRDIHSL
ncbi:MAG: ABC transporter permease [Clostridiaceae bacterium]|nr:ABC transporter permease [Clostridiaceae bacterium]MBW4860890.1 ABC transporter permease [Clostridiaceae bacterium]MBW4867515.1 ABC transporter permease [Clostridiaceae bacterium]